jgi:hypothetical protein
MTIAGVVVLAKKIVIILITIERGSLLLSRAT